MVWIISLAVAIAILALYLVRRNRIHSLNWPAHLSQRRLENLCRLYLEHCGWTVAIGRDRLLYATKPGFPLTIVHCATAATGLREQTIKEIAAVRHGQPWRNVVVTDYPVSGEMADLAVSNGAIAIPYRQLPELERHGSLASAICPPARPAMGEQTDEKETMADATTPAPVPEPKIFILGDSRTGTMTLHRFLESLGISSIHYYVPQSDQIQPGHLHMEENWQRCRDYILNSGFRAFSDYPTRTYFRDLLVAFPDAFFILSVRRDLETWQNSMTKFFAKFSIVLDIPALSIAYEKVNDDIRQLMSASGANFVEICIDDEADKNSETIKSFLGIVSPIQMERKKQTTSRDLGILSRRACFFSPTTDDVISHVESLCHDSKAMPSERGWVYLINDANDFMRYQFGLKNLDSEQFGRMIQTVESRESTLRAKGIAFLNIIVPEKSVVYREFLPAIFETLTENPDRPAPRLCAAAPGIVHYLADYLIDLKSYGLLYFRGDTHANWLGAYFVYLHIAEQMNISMELTGGTKHRLKAPAPIAKLSSQLAEYNGDLYVQLLGKHLDELRSVWKTVQNAGGFEVTLQYLLPEDQISTELVEPPEDYKCLAGERPLFVRENKDQDLPRAVIFRDSTSDFIIELLAEHFSRSVFIWHKGVIIEDIIEREKPDIVLHISAERFVWIFSNQPPFVSLDLMRASAKAGEG